MAANLDLVLRNFGTALSPQLRSRLDPIILQMKGNRSPSGASYVVSQLRLLFPMITHGAVPLLAVYVLGKRGSNRIM